MSPQRRTALVSVVGRGGARRAQADGRARDAQPRARLRGGALGHRPRRGAAHVLRGRRRGAAGRRRRTSSGTARRSTSRRSPRRRSSSLASVFISVRAIERLAGLDARRTCRRHVVRVRRRRRRDRDRRSRTVVSWRTARRYESAALASNALHFGSDLAGSVAGARRPARSRAPAIRTATRSRRSSSACSCCSPRRG